MRLLLATDGSVNADQALASVLDREWPSGTACRVIAVLEPLVKPGFLDIGGLAERAQDSLENDMRAILKEYRQQLEAKFGKDNVSSELLEGNPKLLITEHAQAWAADLIVIGSHGTDADESFFGSVTRAVVLDARCSIQIINAPTAESMEEKQKENKQVKESHYLVCVSEEKNWQAMLDAISKRPWPADSEFKVISVLPTARPKRSRFFKSTDCVELQEKLNDEKRQAALALVDTAAEKLKAAVPHASITQSVMEGNPRNTILQVAQDWPADMIILGEHDGNKNVMDYFLGSTAVAVAWNASCSVELVKLASVAVTQSAAT